MDPAEPQPPVVAGRYRLGQLIGRGGMASVYAAQDLRLGRQVAVKFLDPSLAGVPDVRRRFEDEARSAARLNHPNVVSVFDTGEWEGRAYLVMELLSGRTLSDEIAAGPLTVARARSVLDDLLAALEAAHRAGVLHRDVKPANLLIAPDGRVKVADFGIAKAGAEASELTAAGQIVGTPGYLAPERLAGEPGSAASDLWAAGVVGWEALAGRRAFQAGGAIETAMSIMHTDLAPVAAIRPDADPGLAAAIDGAVRRDPRARWRSAHEMRVALAGGTALPAAVIPPPPPPTRAVGTVAPATVIGPAPLAARRSPSLLYGALATVLVAAIIVVVVLLLRGSGTGSNGGSTGASTSLPPTTAAPTTAGPTTAAPTTRPPETTEPPTTAAPTTVAPTTAPPTTAAPTTVPPTTAAPPTTLAVHLSVPHGRAKP